MDVGWTSIWGWEDFISDRKIRLSSIMTPLSDLVTSGEGVELTDANSILQKSKKARAHRGFHRAWQGKLPIITKSGQLIALVARTDIKCFDSS